MRFVLRWLVLLLCGVVAAGSTGCSLFDFPKPKDPFAEEDSKEKDLSLDYLDQQFKKMTGRGPNRDVAYKLFGEAKSFYSEAVQHAAKTRNPANRLSPKRRRTSTRPPPVGPTRHWRKRRCI